LVWSMTSEWEDHWNTWKSGRFIDVETGDMEEISTTLFRKLQKMSRELKVSSIDQSVNQLVNQSFNLSVS